LIFSLKIANIVKAFGYADFWAILT